MNALIAVILGAITVYLTYTRYARRMGQAQQRLTDEQKTAFFFVTLPEALPIAVISRFIGWFQDFGIPVGGVIVNMLLDKAALGQDVPEFVRNRVQMQEEYMKSIWEKFDGSVRALVPLFDQEVRGCAMLREAAQKLMT
jgi:arsenite/tail-anchored protein-transporting ATPase